MALSKIPIYQISITLLKNSSDIVVNNLYVPISISKTQLGSDYLYIGKKLTVQINNQIITGTYQIKLIDNTEYLLLNSINDLTNVSFSFNDTGIYNEIEVVNSENDLITLTDVFKSLVGSKNQNGYKGKKGLIEPLQIEAIDSLPFENNINSKYFNEINTNTILFYYEKNLNENFNVTFKLKHSLFNAEYSIKTYGTSNFQINQNKFSTSVELNTLTIELLVNKINNNSNTKSLYQIVAKLNNVPTAINTNVEKINIYASIPTTETNLFSSALPLNYVLTNSQPLISAKIFNRNILYYDINGFVSVKDYEETKLTGLDNLNNVWTIGYYFYDTLNVNDIIFNNAPNNIKNIFYLEVKRISSEINIQFFNILDSTNNVIKRFSRYRNSSTSVVTAWTEYVTDKHKHLPADILTDSNNQFVTVAQIAQWNSVTSSQFWKDAVLNKINLPTTASNGETRLVLSENKIYRYDTVTSLWILLNKVTLTRELNSDKVRIKVNEGTTEQTIELPFVSVTNPGIVPTDFYSEDYQNYFETILNFTPTTAGTGIPSSYEKPALKTFNLIKHTDLELKIYDGITNYILGDGTNPLIFDLSSNYNQITKTIYTQVDNNNMFTGNVSEYNFTFCPIGFASKFLFSPSTTVSIISSTTGAVSTITNNELIVDVLATYLFNINVTTNIITIIKIIN